MGRRVMQALGIGTSATHMEWFFGPKGLKFSEIGCRPPGVGCWDLYCAGNDIDLYREWAEAVVYGRTDAAAEPPLRGRHHRAAPGPRRARSATTRASRRSSRHGPVDHRRPPPGAGTPTQPVGPATWPTPGSACGTPTTTCCADARRRRAAPCRSSRAEPHGHAARPATHPDAWTRSSTRSGLHGPVRDHQRRLAGARARRRAALDTMLGGRSRQPAAVAPHAADCGTPTPSSPRPTGSVAAVLEEMQQLYLLGLDHAHAARSPSSAGIPRATRGCVQTPWRTPSDIVREMDARHLERVAERRTPSSGRVAGRTTGRPIAEAREAIAHELSDAEAVVIAGGPRRGAAGRPAPVQHRPRPRPPVIAWGAGAMALTERVVLFHDRAAHGPAHRRDATAGLGLVRRPWRSPSARDRLDLSDPVRMAICWPAGSPRPAACCSTPARRWTSACDGHLPAGAPVVGPDGSASHDRGSRMTTDPGDRPDEAAPPAQAGHQPAARERGPRRGQRSTPSSPRTRCRSSRAPSAPSSTAARPTRCACGTASSNQPQRRADEAGARTVAVVGDHRAARGLAGGVPAGDPARASTTSTSTTRSTRTWRTAPSGRPRCATRSATPRPTGCCTTPTPGRASCTTLQIQSKALRRHTTSRVYLPARFRRTTSTRCWWCTTATTTSTTPR